MSARAGHPPGVFWRIDNACRRPAHLAYGLFASPSRYQRNARATPLAITRKPDTPRPNAPSSTVAKLMTIHKRKSNAHSTILREKSEDKKATEQSNRKRVADQTKAQHELPPAGQRRLILIGESPPGHQQRSAHGNHYQNENDGVRSPRQLVHPIPSSAHSKCAGPVLLSPWGNQSTCP